MDIKNITIVNSWRKLLDHRAINVWEGNTTESVEINREEEMEHDTEREYDENELTALLRPILGTENVEGADISEWFMEDDNLELASSDIIQLVKESAHDK